MALLPAPSVDGTPITDSEYQKLTFFDEAKLSDTFAKLEPGATLSATFVRVLANGKMYYNWQGVVRSAKTRAKEAWVLYSQDADDGLETVFPVPGDEYTNIVVLAPMHRQPQSQQEGSPAKRNRGEIEALKKQLGEVVGMMTAQSALLQDMMDLQATNQQPSSRPPQPLQEHETQAPAQSATSLPPMQGNQDRQAQLPAPLELNTRPIPTQVSAFSPADFAEAVASRGGRKMTDLCTDLRVPAAIDHPYTVLYPHLWWGQASRAAEWRNLFVELLQTLGIVIRAPSVRADYELARDTLFQMALHSARPTDKAQWRVPFYQVHLILQTFALVTGGQKAQEKVRNKLAEKWVAGKLDYEELLRNDITHSVSEETTTAAAQPQTTSNLTAQMEKLQENHKRLAEMFHRQTKPPYRRRGV